MQKSGLLSISFAMLLLATARGADKQSPAANTDDAIIVPDMIADPLEPINRSIWGFNKTINKSLLHPLGKGYRAVVRQSARKRISNFSDNLIFPKHFINNLLQGNWQGAQQQAQRFVVNTTVGGVGLFDPATSLNIPKSDADFGQTLGRWGWDPSMYVVIPVLGPSNERDSIGLMGDVAAHPAIWLTPPYPFTAYGFVFNEIVDKTGEFKRFAEAGADSYASARQLSAVLRENNISEFSITEMPSEPAMNSLNAIFFTHQDPEFPEQAKTRSAPIPSTGKRLKYSLWLQDERTASQSPMVYLLQGLGGSRLDRPSLALAELIFSQGYSVVSVSSTYHSEFMEAASTAAVPGYATVDHQDLLLALGAIDHDLQSKYGNRIGKRALLGISMGAFQTMMLAANGESKAAQGVQFERYIAINPPVDLVSSMEVLDGLYDLALQWPSEERSERIAQIFRKIGFIIAANAQSKKAGQAAALPALPFDRTESGFLIGYAYRTMLRDIIFSSQSRNNLGVLRQPMNKFRRTKVYDEIDHYNFGNYFDSFIVPYYQNGRPAGAASGSDIRYAANLKNYTASLRRVSDLRIISSDNDFLLKDGDLQWLRSLVPETHCKIFHQTGHLGQLATEAGQRAVIESLHKL